MRHRAPALLSLVGALACGVLPSCDEHSTPPEPACPPIGRDAVANLHAFARLYGVVRWFHPSDLAADVDWNRFAIDGAREVSRAEDSRDLARRLRVLFGTIAPSVQISADGESPPAPEAADRGGNVVSWEHYGFEDEDGPAGLYAAKRRGRPRKVAAAGDPFAVVGQSIDARPLRGRRIRLSAKVRTAVRGSAQIWLRVDLADGSHHTENMQDRLVRDPAWVSATVSTEVPVAAVRLNLGAICDSGTAWFDDFKLSVESPFGWWQPIDVRDPGFESTDAITTAWHVPHGGLAGWTLALDHEDPAAGATSLRLSRIEHETTDELFDDAPRPGESYVVELGRGLRARVPISIAEGDGHTSDLPGSNGSPVVSAGCTPPTYDPLPDVADVVVAWNALRHFWPYADDERVDWETVLDSSLRAALDDRSRDDHLMTLRRLVAAVPDGHGSVHCPWEPAPGYFPFEAAEIEGKVFVTASSDRRIGPGDIVESVDGVPAPVILDRATALASGSPQWRRASALDELLRGAAGSAAMIGMRRGDRDVALAVVRSRHPNDHLSPRRAIEERPDGIWYLDLSRAAWSDIEARLPRIAGARGVVIDLRERPSDQSYAILEHLLASPDTADAWMRIPHIIRPDHPAGASWTTTGWNLPAASPRIRGKVAFLVGPTTISYGESIAEVADFYHLGELVGSPTAGANGNMAVVTEPSDCQTYFTGMRVTKLDGGSLFSIGVQPTRRVEATIAGASAGRDEIYEAGIDAVRSPR